MKAINSVLQVCGETIQLRNCKPVECRLVFSFLWDQHNLLCDSGLEVGDTKARKGVNKLVLNYINLFVIYRAQWQKGQSVLNHSQYIIDTDSLHNYNRSIIIE